MFLNAIIFEKLQKVFTQINNSNQFYLTFAPVSTVFSNRDFNFLDTKPSANDTSDKYENQMAFAYFANAIVRNPKMYTLNVEDFLQNNYAKIFENALLVDTSISETDIQAYKDARNVLFVNEDLDPTPEYAKYETYSEKYTNTSKLLAELTEKIMINPEDSESKTQMQALQTKQSILFNDWIISGFKDKIEKAMKIVRNSNVRAEFFSKWNNEYNLLKTDLQKLTTTNSNIEFLPVSCLPNNVYEYNYHGWKKIVLEEAEINNLTEEAKGFLGDDFYNESNDSTLNYCKIEFEYLFVSILRNWFKPELINSSYWSFASDNTEIVSDGTDLTKGLMPSYIDKFIFVRRVCTYSKTEKEETTVPVAASNSKAYRFKDIAVMKDIKQFNKIEPVNSTFTKLRLIDKEKRELKPFILRNLTTLKMENKLNKNVVNKLNLTPIFLNLKPLEIKFNFNLTLIFKDALNNAIGEINAVVTNKKDGTAYSVESGNDGKIVLPNLPSGEYKITVENEELYENAESSILLDNNIEKTLVLEKLTNPRFDLFLIGAINCRFPKLPNPLAEYTYS